MYCVHTGVDCLVVHLYNRIAFLAVGFLRSLFHEIDRLFDRHHVRQFKECRLKNRVGALAHTDLDRLVDRVDCVKLDIVVGNVLLRLCV